MINSHLKQLEQEILSWPQVTRRPHQFLAHEFRFNDAEIGHLHAWGTLDIPYPRALRDALLDEKLAEQHKFVPDSGWTTFHIHGAEDVPHARWLMRLSWLRYALKSAPDPHELLRTESQQLNLSARFVSLLEPFVPAKKAAASA